MIHLPFPSFIFSNHSIAWDFKVRQGPPKAIFRYFFPFRDSEPLLANGRRRSPRGSRPPLLHLPPTGPEKMESFPFIVQATSDREIHRVLQRFLPQVPAETALGTRARPEEPALVRAAQAAVHDHPPRGQDGGPDPRLEIEAEVHLGQPGATQAVRAEPAEAEAVSLRAQSTD